MAIKPQSAKAKGRILQQRIAAMLAEIFELEPGDIESRPMGSPGADLMSSPAARKKFPVTVECKNTKKVPAMDEIKQATYNAYPETLPIVVWKPPRVQYDDSLVVVKLKDLALWFKKYTKNQSKQEVE